MIIGPRWLAWLAGGALVAMHGLAPAQTFYPERGQDPKQQQEQYTNCSASAVLHGLEPDTISSYKFRERLALPALSNSQSVQQSLQSLRDAEDAENPSGAQSAGEGSAPPRRSAELSRS
jgi:hypothetical protein